MPVPNLAPDNDRPVRVFVSGVSSRTHLVHVGSYVQHLLGRTRGPVTLVDLGLRRFLGRSNVAPADLARLLPSDPRLTVLEGGSGRWAAQRHERLVYVAVGAPGLKPYARLRSRHPLRALHVTVVDEGLGSYGSWLTRRDAWRREGGREPWPTVRALAQAAGRRALTDERWALYAYREGRWTLDERVAAPFRAAGPGRGVARPSMRAVPAPGGDPGGDPGGEAVWLSQPWVDLGVISADAYAAHLRRVCAAVAALGLRLVVRPHPGEGAVYTDCPGTARGDVGRDLGPAELDPEVAGAALVLGTTSTALLNVAALHGTPAARVALPELAGLDARLSRAQAGLLDTHLPAAVPLAQLGSRLSDLHAAGPVGSPCPC